MSEGLRARIALGQGSFTLDLSLRLGSGRVLAVVGPNGAGKSTLLRALAGLRGIDSGCIAVEGVVWDDPATGRFLDPARRSVGMLFQDYRLFPTMTALDNAAFGLRARGVGRRRAQRTAADWLERVGVAHRAMARPSELSGGQAQRVALARALAIQPAVLLLDEPFAALDAEARLDLRADLATVLAGFCGQAVVVTHDPNDALALADELLVLDDGRVSDGGPIREAVSHPRSAFVARLLGVNLVHGRVDAGTARLGVFTARAPGIPDGPVLACCRPRDVTVHTSSGGDAVPGRVGQLMRLREAVRVQFSEPAGLLADIPVDPSLDPSAAEPGMPGPGSRVWLSVPDGSWQIYPPTR